MFHQKNREYMAEPILDWILNGIPSPQKVKLFDDVGFIYEVQLAKMELSSCWDDPEEFRKRAAYYEEVDGKKVSLLHIKHHRQRSNRKAQPISYTLVSSL